ncbi:MAG: hypothetical protein HUU30_13835 [Burkholderiaceae bacterium]|jgi:hypothetical protein|nr:hypothetical protein [Aquabacterium sp.]NUP86815.1 hypothetical protein [Burkholderiaceae bacterium]
MGSPSPYAVPIDAALGSSEPLGRLAARLRESQARLDTVRPSLAPPLRELVRAGPLDDDGWALLVPHPAAAAKLRQQLPALVEALEAAGWPQRALRVRIVAGG